MKKILLIGDLIIDVMHRGEALKISSETPTIVGRELETKILWGGAGCLARHLVALGGDLSFITVIGDDVWGLKANAFEHQNLSKQCVVERGRGSTVKERFWVDGYKLLQWDYLDNRPISEGTERLLFKQIGTALSDADVCIVSDYRHGMLSQPFAQSIVSLCAERNVPLYIDSQVAQSAANHLWYKGATVFFLNKTEAAAIDTQYSPDDARASARRLLDILDASNIILKLGSHGCAYATRDAFGVIEKHPVTSRDTTGSGDAFLASYTVSDGELSERLKRANIWAALSTTIIGTEPPSKEEFDAICSL